MFLISLIGMFILVDFSSFIFEQEMLVTISAVSSFYIITDFVFLYCMNKLSVLEVVVLMSTGPLLSSVWAYVVMGETINIYVSVYL